MDDKGFAFTPLTFLLLVPVMILAVSYNGIINEVNAISAIAIGGDVTITIANNIITDVDLDTADAGRNSALIAVETVVNATSIYSGNQPFFGTSGDNHTGSNSKAFIINSTVNMLNSNITNTCRKLEKQTGRSIYINTSSSGQFTYVDPNANGSMPIFSASDLNLTQSDPYGFNITVTSIPIEVVQNNQSVQFKTPVRNVYVSIVGLEDPYIWVNTKERNTSVIYNYPYYTSQFNDYHFADNVSSGNLNYLWECFNGPNVTVMGPRPYYFPDTHGLSFFDRLENRTNYSSGSPTSARMSTFIIYDPLQEDHQNLPISMLDHEYFNSTLVTGYVITTTHGASVTNVLTPTGKNFLISTIYRGYLNLQTNYPY